MPVPTVITDLSTTAASNYPAGTDSPSTLDDVQRAHASFIRTLYNGDTTLYTPAGTGAVATTVQAKLRESVSVKDFGAVGDGVTDDTVAIQAALDADGDVWFPAGEYKITASLNLSVSKRIVGEGGPSASTIRTQVRLLPQGNFACFKNKTGTTGEQYNIEGFNIFWENVTPLSTESATKGNRFGFKFVADGVAQYTAPYSQFIDVEVNGAWYVYYDDSDNYLNKFKSVIGAYCRFGFYKRLGTLMHFEECGNSIGAQGFHFDNTISPILINCAADSLTPDASTPGLSGNYFVDANSVSILGWDAELALINGDNYSYLNFTRTYGTITGFTGLGNDLNCTAGQFVSWFLFTDNSNVTVSGFTRKFNTAATFRFIGSAGNVATIRSIVSSRCTLINSDVRAPSSGTPTNRYSVFASGGFATVIDSVFDNQFSITTRIVDGNIITNSGVFGTSLESGAGLKISKGGEIANGAVIAASTTKTVTVSMTGTGSYSALISAGMNVYGGGGSASALWLVNGDVANNNFILTPVSGPTNLVNCVIGAASAGAGTVTFTMQNTNGAQTGRVAVSVHYAQSDDNLVSVTIT